MKRSYVQINGVLYERGHEPVAEGVYVVPDIKPYVSQITGEVIDSRSKHREHLRMHGCTEIGDQVGALVNQSRRDPFDSSQRKELIRAQVDAMSHADFKRALRRDADRVKWNSRER